MKKIIKYALISLYDKSNLNLILKTLKKYNIKIISSGGTSKEIKRIGFSCIDVSKFTQSSEILLGIIFSFLTQMLSFQLLKQLFQ